MGRYQSYISTASRFIQSYNGVEPFVYFIKKQFAASKKFGSRDRKTISSLCYSYFRCMHLFEGESTAQKLVKGFFLCVSESHPLLQEISPELNEKCACGISEKLEILGQNPAQVFPFAPLLGEGMDPMAFGMSFLRQPLLYLRIRPGMNKHVADKLKEAEITFDILGEDAIGLRNATSLDIVLKLNKEVVVQDLNSQRVFDYPEGLSDMASREKKMSVWDCCAASGGKSILLYDRMRGNIQLTVSDIRENILHNLKQRLQEARLPVYSSIKADLLQGIPPGMTTLFDMVICDVPCSGSGTWSRTPEQLAFFKPDVIASFAEKQKKIASNVIEALKPGGMMYYITCSVFKEENEGVVMHLQKELPLQLLHKQYLKGYENRADTLFVALLRKATV